MIYWVIYVSNCCMFFAMTFYLISIRFGFHFFFNSNFYLIVLSFNVMSNETFNMAILFKTVRIFNNYALRDDMTSTLPEARFIDYEHCKVFSDSFFSWKKMVKYDLGSLSGSELLKIVACVNKHIFWWRGMPGNPKISQKTWSDKFETYSLGHWAEKKCMHKKLLGPTGHLKIAPKKGTFLIGKRHIALNPRTKGTTIQN